MEENGALKENEFDRTDEIDDVTRKKKGISRLSSISTGLFLVASGVIILVSVGYLINYDVTTWSKDVTLILFDSRSGESISLGVGLRVIHYLIIALALLFSGLTILITQSAKSICIEEREIEMNYSNESSSSPSTLTANVILDVLNNGVFPVKLSEVKTTLILNEVKLDPLSLTKEKYVIPARKNQQLTLTWSKTGDVAKTLHSTNEYTLNLGIRGEASCLLYKTPFVSVSRHSLHKTPIPLSA